MEISLLYEREHTVHVYGFGQRYIKGFRCLYLPGLQQGLSLRSFLKQVAAAGQRCGRVLPKLTRNRRPDSWAQSTQGLQACIDVR